MLTLWRDAQILPAQRGKRQVHVRAYPYAEPGRHGLGCLRTLHLPPGGRFPRHPFAGAELVTYVREGTVMQEDATRRPGIVRAGEFSRVNGGDGIRWTATNASQTEWAQVLQVCLGNPPADVEPGCEIKRFSTAERRGKLCVVASRDGRHGSLRIHHDAILCSAVISRGRHVVYELSTGTSAWIHLVSGTIALREHVLTENDGAGVSAERALSFTAREESEILLLHFGDPSLVLPGHEAAPQASRR